MSSNANWMGINFTNSEHNPSSGEFRMLPEGRYKATIKDVECMITDRNIPTIVIYFDLPEEGVTVTSKYFEDPSHQYAEMFKNNVKNLFSRVYYSNISEDEYRKLNQFEVNKELSGIKTPEQIRKLFIGKTITIGIEQKPFISKTKDKTINFSNIPFNSVENIPASIKKIIPVDVKYSQFPKILFSNQVKLISAGFMTDYGENQKRRNSAAYDWWQELTNNPFKDKLIGEDEIPFGDI
jgi:hypothetical protein